jgi:hypothetical protein
VVGITVFASILLVNPVADTLLPEKLYTTPLIVAAIYNIKI